MESIKVKKLERPNISVESLASLWQEGNGLVAHFPRVSSQGLPIRAILKHGHVDVEHWESDKLLCLPISEIESVYTTCPTFTNRNLRYSDGNFEEERMESLARKRVAFKESVLRILLPGLGTNTEDIQRWLLINDVRLITIDDSGDDEEVWIAGRHLGTFRWKLSRFCPTESSIHLFTEEQCRMPNPATCNSCGKTVASSRAGLYNGLCWECSSKAPAPKFANSESPNVFMIKGDELTVRLWPSSCGKITVREADSGSIIGEFRCADKSWCYGNERGGDIVAPTAFDSTIVSKLRAEFDSHVEWIKGVSSLAPGLYQPIPGLELIEEHIERLEAALESQPLRFKDLKSGERFQFKDQGKWPEEVNQSEESTTWLVLDPLTSNNNNAVRLLDGRIGFFGPDTPVRRIAQA